MTTRDKLPQVVSVRKKDLQARGWRDFEHWASDPGNLYIGRNMTFYVAGTCASKWHNPFKASQNAREDCLRRYEEYVRANPQLSAAIPELAGLRELGCWCHPLSCHGDVLVRLLAEKIIAQEAK